MVEEETRGPGEANVFVIRGAAGLLFWKSEGRLAAHEHSEEERRRMSEKRLGERIVE
jgi:hypothetical protein